MRIREKQYGACIAPYRNVLYLCHRNADPDAIGCSFALSRAFGGSIGAADDLSRTGAYLADILGARILINPPVDDYDLVVVVDTSVSTQLGDRLPKSYALVDHHLDKGLLDGSLFYIQKPTKSTAEIVWTILKENGKTIEKRAALGLMAGLIADTGRFKRASTGTFLAAAEILKAGGFDYEEAQDALSVPADLSQRIALLKAASRCEVTRQGDWLIACTEVNSFEGSAAMALVDLGADVAFVAGRHGKSEKVRISARSSREAACRNINLAKLLGEVARAYGGDGGGHRSAAALEAIGDPSVLLDACRKKLLESLT
ncbi:MAG: putative manganese-dependent inorganic pyrophosphatase [Methanosaeta sp. PtaU1.Bin112]|nr:MAG: putative manganese-dependent inorganic pyrophosphatase [Methanosaeta sp. PtaU1.Bin112]